MKKLIALIMLLALSLTCFAACNQLEQTNAINDAGNYLYNLYKDNDETTPSDYDIVSRVMVGTTAFPIEWTVEVDPNAVLPEGVNAVEIKESATAGFYTVDVFEKAEADIPYTLTGTIKDETIGLVISHTFNRVIPAFKVLSYAEYAAAADDTAVAVKGIITGIISPSTGSAANGLYMQDLNEEGGYYVYGTKDKKDPLTELGLEIGMTVIATGMKDTYSGLYEVIDAAIEVVNDGEITEVTPVDYTEAYANAQALTERALVGRQSMLVTIKGVEITGQNLSSGYYKFKLGELESYVRLSSSNNPITLEEKAQLKELHTEYFGYTADVTGLVALYNGAFYLVPVSGNAFTNFTLPDRSDAEKIEMEIGAIDFFQDRYTEAATIALPAVGGTYAEVKFAWQSNNECAVYNEENNTLAITPGAEDAEVTVTVFAECNGASAQHDFTFVVEAATSDLYVVEEVKAPTAGTYAYYLYQANLDATLYFAGYMSGNYLATTDNAAKAAMVTLEEVEGGYRMSFMDGDVKKYIDVYEYTAGKVGVQLTEAPTAVFTYNAELGVMVATVAGTEYYLGTYNSYSTISASKLSYISGANASKIGVSQFPAVFGKLVAKEIAPVAATTFEQNVAYKYGLYQATLGQQLYFAGYKSGNYLATTDKLSKAVDVYVETVTDATGENTLYYLYFMDGEAKQYIDIYEYTAGKVGVQIANAPGCAYAYNAELGVMVATVAGTEYYLGTYNSYSTISASKLSYISGANASKIGVSQFPAYLYNIEFVEEGDKPVEPDQPVEPEQPAGITYTFADYSKGTQYAEGEVHVLDDVLTVTTTQAHFTSEIRLYSSSSHDGFAVFQAKKYITGLTLNAGNKADVLNVYVSEDGQSWTLLEGISTATSYKDYTVSKALNTAWIKLDVAGSNQVRVKSITVTYGDEIKECAHEYATEWSSNENGHWHACTLCAAADKVEEHVGGTATTTALANCSVCGAPYGELLPVEVTIEEAIKLADGTNVIVTGTVKSVASDWQGYNVYITDATGELYLYQLATEVTEGELIKVTGKMATYKDARQIGQGATAEILTAHTCSFSTEWVKDGYKHWNECECGEKANEADHVYGENGLCVCGAEKPEEDVTPVEQAIVLSAVSGGTTYYVTLTLSNGTLKTTTNKEEAAAFYREATETEGVYYIYYLDAQGAKQYVYMTSNATKAFAFTADKATANTWKFDNANKQIINSAFSTRAIAFYANSSDVRTYATTNSNPWFWFE